MAFDLHFLNVCILFTCIKPSLFEIDGFSMLSVSVNGSAFIFIVACGVLFILFYFLYFFFLLVAFLHRSTMHDLNSVTELSAIRKKINSIFFLFYFQMPYTQYIVLELAYFHQSLLNFDFCKISLFILCRYFDRYFFFIFLICIVIVIYSEQMIESREFEILLRFFILSLAD